MRCHLGGLGHSPADHVSDFGSSRTGWTAFRMLTVIAPVKPEGMVHPGCLSSRQKSQASTQAPAHMRKPCVVMGISERKCHKRESKKAVLQQVAKAVQDDDK